MPQRKPRVVSALAVGLFLALILSLIAQYAQAQTAFVPPDYSCVPPFQDLQRKLQYKDGIFAAVWWCELPSGTESYYSTATPTTEQVKDVLTQIENGDIDLFNLKPVLTKFVTRDATEAEKTAVSTIERRFGPRCYVDTTVTTAAIYSSTGQLLLGAVKKDATGVTLRIKANTTVSCNAKLADTRRYCAATGFLDTKGRALPEDSWVACRLQKGPSQGWPDQPQ